MKYFASIYLGTNEILEKIFEIGPKGLKAVDRKRKPVAVATDVINKGTLKHETCDMICTTIADMKATFETYQVDGFRLYGNVLLSEADNYYYLADQIHQRTGLSLEILSNSENRFLSYRAAASMPDFDSMLVGNTAIVDIGGTSLQITLFHDTKVVTTQHLSLGSITLGQSMIRLNQSGDAREQINEIIHKELDAFSTIYLKDTRLDNLILLGEQLASLADAAGYDSRGHQIDGEKYTEVLNKIDSQRLSKVADEAEFGFDRSFVEAYILIQRGIANEFLPDHVFIPGVGICEGIACQYSYTTKAMTTGHDFDEDVISAAWSIAKRYDSYQPHLKALERLSLQIFDTMKKYHGMGKRSRLLMRTIVILHDCGKYISIAGASDCSYTIVMNSEILGLSHKERELVALVIAYNRKPLDSYEELQGRISSTEYIMMVKLLAILKIANAMDRSHKQKFKNVKMSVKDHTLSIAMEAEASLNLERGLFEEKADFFENVFGIRPVIKEKKVLGA